MFFILILLFHICSSTIDAKAQLEPKVNFHSRLKDACNVYEDALPNLLDNIFKLFKDTLEYVFVSWPADLSSASGSERIADKDTLAKGSVILEKSILRVQALVIKDIGHILDEIADAINLTSILKKMKATGFKLHVI